MAEEIVQMLCETVLGVSLIWSCAWVVIKIIEFFKELTR